MTEASLEQNMTAARREHLVPGREIRMRDTRGYRFCEVGLITGTSQDNAIADVWNATGACDPTPEQFDTLEADTIASENEALGAWLNPVRHWLCDRLDVQEAGGDRTFGGITGTWMRVAGASTLMPGPLERSYDPGYIYWNNVLTFIKDSEIYLLDAPDGEVFVLQSFTQYRDANLSEDDLAHLSERLDLPGGWDFRAEVLDDDLEISSSADNLAHVLHDNLDNVYQGSDAGRAFTGTVSQTVFPDRSR